MRIRSCLPPIRVAGLYLHRAGRYAYLRVISEACVEHAVWTSAVTVTVVGRHKNRTSVRNIALHSALMKARSYIFILTGGA
eukprot:scaffold43382_cov33-Prasinocladus_malaysianus.AAC.1